MEIQVLLSLICFILAGSTGLFFATMYLFRRQFMPYHAADNQIVFARQIAGFIEIITALPDLHRRESDALDLLEPIRPSDRGLESGKADALIDCHARLLLFS